MYLINEESLRKIIPSFLSSNYLEKKTMYNSHVYIYKPSNNVENTRMLHAEYSVCQVMAMVVVYRVSWNNQGAELYAT